MRFLKNHQIERPLATAIEEGMPVWNPNDDLGRLPLIQGPQVVGVVKYTSVRSASTDTRCSRRAWGARRTWWTWKAELSRRGRLTAARSANCWRTATSWPTIMGFPCIRSI